MASDILAIYDALAAVTVSDGVTAVAARDIADQPNSLETANTPVRILTVIDPLVGQQQARSVNAHGADAGSSFYAIDWIIYDVLIYRPHVQGRGVMDMNVPLLTYMANYYAMTAALTPAGNWTIDVVAMQPRVIEYPLRSGRWWFGVRVQLTIRDRSC